MRIAVVGATGLVGSKIIKLLEERNFPVKELIPIASSSSVGKKINFQNREFNIITADEALKLEMDIALFSAGSETSIKYAPLFAEKGTFVIDNSSAWRMHKKIPLVVPEINPETISEETKIIANPNCSTIQMVLALFPLHKNYGLDRIVVSTYQSVSGTGKAALDQMNHERQGEDSAKVYPYPIDQNCIPHCDVFLENGYTKEEMKLVHETQKILGDSSIRVSSTAVRVPVTGGHSESVNARFKKDYELSDVRKMLHEQEGIVLKDNIDTLTYPMPLYAKEKDEVFVGRLRRDESDDNTLNMWIVADNLRKGAATNAVQIAEYCLKFF
ncbi:MAG: aspartate-semialdehyde dehydrogenase [Flavobacteriales bacterium]|jgi:aspartate-semialdehyde dehydrogenase|nr:aspartate-semialdehyde dehydrogenase [Flavobacteriales bacterium]